MQQAHIISDPDGRGDRKVPVGSSLTIGRAIDCGFVIDDSAASRHHLEVFPKGDGYRWKDLGSTNGTMLNGNLMREGLLTNGDELQIGETVFRFVVEEIADPVKPDDDTTILKEALLDWKTDSAVGAEGTQQDALLRAVYKVVNDIASNYEPCGLVDRILETTMRAIDAQRGTVLFTGGASEHNGPCPACGKYHIIEDGVLRHVTQQDIRISQTVAQRVLRGGESLLYQDTDHDTELNISESIMSLNLLSIICVPLRGKYGIIGLLYIDSDRPGQQYSHDDMLLTTAVGNSAGLALENANLHRQILEKERTDQEIEHAWTIQEGFLVKDWPEDAGTFEVFGQTKPAKTVGGDFYDFIVHEDNSVGILLGDVSGKGVPAALTMAQLLAEFRVYARMHRSPLTVIEHLHEGLYKRSQRGMFCTLAYATLNLDTGEVCCANAGHHPALCLGGLAIEFAPASGPPLGVTQRPQWKEETTTLAPGGGILMYSDGIVEARAPETHADVDIGPDEFGVKKLCEILQDSVDASPRRLVTRILEDVARYSAPIGPHDDCTLIGLRYLGAGSNRLTMSIPAHGAKGD